MSTTGHRAATAPAMGWLARAGLVARGVVYAVIGVLALKLALGDGGKATSQQGALKTIGHGSFGTFLLVLLAIGLAAMRSGGWCAPRSVTAPSRPTSHPTVSRPRPAGSRT